MPFQSAAMRPATPNFNFAQQTAPSSPPQTPTMAHAFGTNRRHGMHFTTQLPTKNLNIIPNGQGTGFSYVPSTRPADLSPRSSSPSSSAHSSASASPPRSLTSTPGEPLSSSSPPPRHSRITTDANFTVEEIRESDYEDFDSDDESVIIPEYEDAESVKSTDLPSKLYNDLRNLQCEAEDHDTEAHDAYVKMRQAEKRRKRRSSSTIQKRTFSQSIGSDTDEEDVLPVFEGANEAGSSARRLRRKGPGDERTSLIFDDPPPRIDELEEPESCEEVVSDDEEGQCVDRNLPYYVQDMEVDSDEE